MADLTERQIWTLLDAMLAGDERSLSTLYHGFSRRIYAFAMKPLRDPHEAEQVVIDTMYEVWRQASRFDRKCRFSTWVLGIARNKILHALRDRMPQYDDLLAVQDCLPCESADPFAHVVQRQEQAWLQAGMRELPAAQRECLEFVLREDMALADIAQRQGCPENTVKTRLFKARHKLKGQLSRVLRLRGSDATRTDEARLEALNA